MYVEDRYIFKDSIEHEIKYAGNYGAAGEKRQKRTKATPEQVKAQNQRNRVTRMRRTIKANFSENDLYITLKYPKGTRKELKEVKKDIRQFKDKMRRRYKSLGTEFRFVERLEIGRLGGIHAHLIIPRIRGHDTEVIVQKAWIHGRANFQNLDDGEYEELAAYIVKLPSEEVEKQLKQYSPSERKEFIKVSTSRNLIRPVPERREYRRRTVKKIITEGPTAKQGYYIVPKTFTWGVNPYNGMSYIRYTERKCGSG